MSDHLCASKPGNSGKHFPAGQRATIADAALPFFFAQATFHEQPELIRRYRDKVINFADAENGFSVCPRGI